MHSCDGTPGLGLDATEFDSSLLPSSGPFFPPLTGEEMENTFSIFTDAFHIQYITIHEMLLLEDD